MINSMKKKSKEVGIGAGIGKDAKSCVSTGISTEGISRYPKGKDARYCVSTGYISSDTPKGKDARYCVSTNQTRNYYNN